MKRWISVLTLCSVGMAATDPVGADPLAPLEYQVLESAINDDSLDKMTKISRIGEFFKADPNCHQAWMWVARVDESFAAKGLKREFKNPKRDQQEKLTIGRTLLSDQRFNGDKEFIDEYAPWLIDQVVAQETNIKQVLVEYQLTPVGEYANIANGFQGHSVENFFKIKDKRVIPVLIAALEMPDTVYGEHRGCDRGGKPGEGTQRNVDRQNVPIALAKLGAANSVPALRRTLETHHDWYLRDNSALALAMLLDPAQREELVGWLEKRMADDYKLDRFRHLFAFGKGLLNSGDDAGVEFMAFEYSIYHNNCAGGDHFETSAECVAIVHGGFDLGDHLFLYLGISTSQRALTRDGANSIDGDRF